MTSSLTIWQLNRYGVFKLTFGDVGVALICLFTAVLFGIIWPGVKCDWGRLYYCPVYWMLITILDGVVE